MKVSERYDAIRDDGGQVLAVSFEDVEAIAAYRKRNEFPFEVGRVDLERDYAAWGLSRTSWWRMLHPKVLGRYVRALFGGRQQVRKATHDDVLQLGGDFVIAPGGTIALAHPSSSADDRPPVLELVRAVREATADDGPDR